VSKDAAVQVKDGAALEKAVADLLASSARREELGIRARDIVAENLGAVERTAEMIVHRLEKQGMLVVPKKKVMVEASGRSSKPVAA
jgi:hypothetical protein